MFRGCVRKVENNPFAGRSNQACDRIIARSGHSYQARGYFGYAVQGFALGARRVMQSVSGSATQLGYEG